MTVRQCLACFCLGVGILPACQYIWPDARVLAKVGNTKVSVKEFKDTVSGIKSNSPLDPWSSIGRKSILDVVIVKKILAIKAKEECAQKKTPAVCLIVANATDEGTLSSQYFDYLHSEELVPTAQEVDAYYAIHKKEFGMDQDEIRIIYTKDLLISRKALRELQKGTPFDAVARRLSQDPTTAKNGGKLIHFHLGYYNSQLEKIILDLPVNQTSNIIRTSSGFYIIRKSGPPRPTYTQAIQIIRHGLMVQKYRDWLSAARASVPIQIDTQLLASLH